MIKEGEGGNKTQTTTYLQELMAQVQKIRNMKLFKKKYADISKREGIMGENRIKTVDKAFEIITDHLLTDTIAHYFYLMETDPANPFYLPDYDKLK